MSPQKGPNVGQVMGYAKISMNIRLELKDSYYPPTYSHFVCQIEFIVDLLVDIDPKTYITTFTPALDLDVQINNIKVTDLEYSYYTFMLTLVLLNPDIPSFCKQCRSRSVGF